MNVKAWMLPALVLTLAGGAATEARASGSLFGPGVTRDGQWSTFSLIPWWWQSKGCPKNAYCVLHYWTPSAYFIAFHRAETYTFPRDLNPGVPISQGTIPYHCRAVPPVVFFPQTYPPPFGSNYPSTGPTSPAPGANEPAPGAGSEGPELGPPPERLPPPKPTTEPKPAPKPTPNPPSPEGHGSAADPIRIE
jgi:hypothetical protein